MAIRSEELITDPLNVSLRYLVNLQDLVAVVVDHLHYVRPVLGSGKGRDVVESNEAQDKELLAVVVGVDKRDDTRRVCDQQE
jgi:hypothetical protein